MGRRAAKASLEKQVGQASPAFTCCYPWGAPLASATLSGTGAGPTTRGSTLPPGTVRAGHPGLRTRELQIFHSKRMWVLLKKKEKNGVDLRKSFSGSPNPGFVDFHRVGRHTSRPAELTPPTTRQQRRGLPWPCSQSLRPQTSSQRARYCRGPWAPARPPAQPAPPHPLRAQPHPQVRFLTSSGRPGAAAGPVCSPLAPSCYVCKVQRSQ